jgi:hypothetical protein
MCCLSKNPLLILENEAEFKLHNKRSDEYLDLLKQIRVHSVDGQIKVGICAASVIISCHSLLRN